MIGECMLLTAAPYSNSTQETDGCGVGHDGVGHDSCCVSDAITHDDRPDRQTLSRPTTSYGPLKWSAIRSQLPWNTNKKLYTVSQKTRHYTVVRNFAKC